MCEVEFLYGEEGIADSNLSMTFKILSESPILILAKIVLL
jgi:hypothetical protein